jgi:hypothetical protein
MSNTLRQREEAHCSTVAVFCLHHVRPGGVEVLLRVLPLLGGA